MQEVLHVTVVEPIEQLLHEGGDVILTEMTHAGLQQTHQIMVHVLKHQVERT